MKSRKPSQPGPLGSYEKGLRQNRITGARDLCTDQLETLTSPPSPTKAFVHLNIMLFKFPPKPIKMPDL